MKKIVVLLIIGSLASINVFAQEVRGVEISLTEYNGHSYTVAYRQQSQNDEISYHERNYSLYYGYLITNKKTPLLSP